MIAYLNTHPKCWAGLDRDMVLKELVPNLRHTLLDRQAADPVELIPFEADPSAPVQELADKIPSDPIFFGDLPSDPQMAKEMQEHVLETAKGLRVKVERLKNAKENSVDAEVITKGRADRVKKSPPNSRTDGAEEKQEKAKVQSDKDAVPEYEASRRDDELPIDEAVKTFFHDISAVGTSLGH